METTKRNTKLMMSSFAIFAAAALMIMMGSADATGSFSLGMNVNVGLHNPAVQNLCSQAEYKDLCLNSIAPQFTGKTDSTALLEIMITAAEQAVKKALNLVVEMKGKASADVIGKDQLKTCKGKYKDALEEMHGAKDALKVKDFSTCQTELSASITYISDCSDAFEGEIGEETHPEKNPLRQVNENLREMVGNCLSIGNVLLKNS